MPGRRMIPVRIVAAAAVLALLPLTAACGKKEESKSINIPGLGKIETKETARMRRSRSRPRRERSSSRVPRP